MNTRIALSNRPSPRFIPSLPGWARPELRIVLGSTCPPAPRRGEPRSKRPSRQASSSSASMARQRSTTVCDPPAQRLFRALHVPAARSRRCPSPPTRQPREPRLAIAATKTNPVATIETCESRETVPLDSPMNASPRTGITGAPHPITLHVAVDSASVLTSAPATPPRRPRCAELRNDGSVRVRCAQTAKYAPKITDITRKRSRSPKVTAYPHSIPKTPSDENQKTARPRRKSSLWPREMSPEARNEGSDLSQGLKVKKSTRLRATDRTNGGNKTLSTRRLATAARKIPGLARIAAAIPESVLPRALTSRRIMAHYLLVACDRSGMARPVECASFPRMISFLERFTLTSL